MIACLATLYYIQYLSIFLPSARITLFSILSLWCLYVYIYIYIWSNYELNISSSTKRLWLSFDGSLQTFCSKKRRKKKNQIAIARAQKRNILQYMEFWCFWSGTLLIYLCFRQTKRPPVFSVLADIRFVGCPSDWQSMFKQQCQQFFGQNKEFSLIFNLQKWHDNKYGKWKKKKINTQS